MMRPAFLFMRFAAAFVFAAVALVGAAHAQQKADFAYFDGDNTLTFPDHYSLDIGPTGVVEFWVSAGWDDADMAPVALSYVGVYGPRYALGITPDKKGLVFYSGEDFGVVAADFSDGKLHHVAVFTYDKLTDAYVDGAYAGTYPLGYGDVYGSTFNIGSLDGVSRKFTGYVGRVRIWDRALPVATVLERRNTDYLSKKGALAANPVYQALIGLSNFTGAVDKFILTYLNDDDIRNGQQYGTSGYIDEEN
jgi:hypothetical protein